MTHRLRTHMPNPPADPVGWQPLYVDSTGYHTTTTRIWDAETGEEFGGGDELRQFQPVFDSAFNQDRPTEQQKYPLSPAAWGASASQLVIQYPAPPNESPQITQYQRNLLPDLQPVSPSLYNPVLAAMYAPYELEVSTPLDHLPSSFF